MVAAHYPTIPTLNAHLFYILPPSILSPGLSGNFQFGRDVQRMEEVTCHYGHDVLMVALREILSQQFGKEEPETMYALWRPGHLCMEGGTEVGTPIEPQASL